MRNKLNYRTIKKRKLKNKLSINNRLYLIIASKNNKFKINLLEVQGFNKSLKDSNMIIKINNNIIKISQAHTDKSI
jgi:hypothetical protein